MLPYPAPTSREEKLEMVNVIKERLLSAHGDKIMAIGVYGSIGIETDGPYSDIEMHVVTEDGIQIKGHEFVYDKFKIEISIKEKSDLLAQARTVDDSWPIRAGECIGILPVYDPNHFFDEIKSLPLQVSDLSIKETMKEFMIWEPYETIAKIRNNYRIQNLDYIPLGAKDLTWQTAKLIGLANKHYFSTRARTYEESIKMKIKPSGYLELVRRVMQGKLGDSDHVYQLCETLWSGLNEWYQELGIDYKVKELPF